MINLVECQPSFRLWISAEPHPKFPIGLLQMSIKITNEAPAGVRAGLKGSYSWINQDMLDAVSQPQWRVMLYALCFMHTVVQERRKFGPLGFNVPYEFNQSDLSACVTFMQNHLNDMETKKRPVDWIVVNYMVCMVQYGGRITDDWDRRLFNTYGKAWLTQQCLDPTFEFHEGYIVPANKPTYPGTEIADYRKCVKGLPLAVLGVVGLHLLPMDLLTTASHACCAQVHRGPAPGGRPRDLRAARQRRPRLPLLTDQGRAWDHPGHPAQGGRRRRRADARGGGVEDGRGPAGQAAARLQGRRRQDGDQGVGRHGQAAQHLPQAGDRPAAEGPAPTFPPHVQLLVPQQAATAPYTRSPKPPSHQVISVVRAMLANLKLAIAGTIVMSPDLADALDALFMARVPATWTKVSQLVAPNMGVWFVNILTRAEQFTNWLRNGRPSSFWLTGFFNPTGFLTANRQEVCRKHSKDGWALDDVIDASEVLRQERDEVKKGPEEGIYIYGLYLDCAKWDKEKNRLADSDPKVCGYRYARLALCALPSKAY